MTGVAPIDLVIEHGPHVIQPVEMVNGTWVYWSVGNFTSGMGTAASGRYSDQRTLDELAATARFTETSPGVFAVEPWPVLLCNEPFSRTLYAPITALAEPLPPIVQSGLQACVRRSRVCVQPGRGLLAHAHARRTAVQQMRSFTSLQRAACCRRLRVILSAV